MNIAFLTPEYPHKNTTKSAGLGSSIKNLAIGLTKNSHQVTVFVYSQANNEVFKDEGVEIHTIAYKKYPVLGWYLYRKDIQNYVNSIIQKEDIQLLEAPEWTGITAFMKLKVPVIIRLHGSDTYFCHLENRKQKFKNFCFEKKALTSADYIVSVSEFTTLKTKELFKLTSEISVIYNGIDTEYFSYEDTVPTSNTILYFGTIIRKKGVLELANIFNEVVKENPNVTLQLIGKDVIDSIENSSTIELFYQLLSTKAKEQVQYTTEVPYEKIKDFIKKATVVVLPSFAEAFPMTWLEAMAMGKALVTSNIGWANELMVDGETGFTENPKNHKEYAAKIVKLLEDKELNLKFGECANKRIHEQFSQEIIVGKNIEFYKSLLK